MKNCIDDECASGVLAHVRAAESGMAWGIGTCFSGAGVSLHLSAQWA